MFRFTKHDITYIEHPYYTSLTYFISGCPLNCLNCHSQEFKNNQLGEQLTTNVLISHLDKYHQHIQNVVFLGGEWDSPHLITLLQIVHSYNLKTTLYTGLNQLDLNIIKHLDYVKYGPYIEKYGPLNVSTTNQKMIDLKNNEDITNIFLKKKPL